MRHRASSGASLTYAKYSVTAPKKSCEHLVTTRSLITAFLCLSLLLPATVRGQGSFAATTQATTTITTTVGWTTITSMPTQIVAQSFTAVHVFNAATFACNSTVFTFAGEAGQHVSGNFASDVFLYFYIMTDSNFRSVACPYQESPKSIVERYATSYSFDVVLSSSDQWDIVLVNPGTSGVAKGYIEAYLWSNVQTSQVALFSTTTETTSIPLTQTTTTPSFTAEGVSALILGIVAVAIALAFLLSRRRKLKAERTEKAEAPQSKLCPKCNSVLPKQAQFCDECGAVQT